MRTKILMCIMLLVSMSVISATENDALVVFLVRHAEKLSGGHDPDLSAAGFERAKELAAVLRDSGITHIHSSDYIRTRKTAAPVAATLGLEVALYNPRELPALVDELRKAGGTHLVVGHSNTTPSMVELLGGDPGGAIDEPGEYDRLYVVTIDADGLAHTVLLRYGKKFTVD